MKTGLYLYGVIPTQEHQRFGALKVGKLTAPDVWTTGSHGLAMVVSSVPMTDYSTLTREEVVRALALHQLVVEKVMQRFTIIPVKFGTMLETEDEVAQLLENEQELLEATFATLAGKIELDVTATWEIAKMVPLVVQHNPKLQELQQQLAYKDEQSSMQEQLQLGQTIAQAMNAEKERYQQRIVQVLQPNIEEICIRDLVKDEMVFSAAFLLMKDAEAQFEVALNELDQQLESRLNFRIVGPLPPYSFATLHIHRLTASDIDDAKKTLGLTGDVSKTAAREVYRQLAKEYHPDTADEADVSKFQRIQAAYEVVTNFITYGSFYAEIHREDQVTEKE
jgi:hypothetical protein